MTAPATTTATKVEEKVLSADNKASIQQKVMLESLQEESTLLALEKEMLQVQLKDQLEAQLRAQKEASAKQMAILSAERQRILSATPPPIVLPPLPPLAPVAVAPVPAKKKMTRIKKKSTPAMEVFNLGNKSSAKRAAADCDDRGQEDCKKRSSHCHWMKVKKRKSNQKKHRCEIRCSDITSKTVCKYLPECVYKNGGNCRNK